MDQEELLDNERVEKTLSPHPLSFMKLQSVCLFLIIWGVLFGWLINFSEYRELFSGNEWYPVLIWGTVLLLAGVIASLVAIRWSIFFLYLGVFAGWMGVMFSQGWLNNTGVFIPFYSIAVSIIGFLIVELYRRSHKYIITNLRIIFKGGVITKRARTLRYDKIADLGTEQGVLGQIFGFGTIIPVSQSGLGLGSDDSFAAGGVKLGGKKVGILGIFGGGKEVKTPRSRSYY
ncbi:putative membrane protein, partial [Thermoplasmatales archaeon SCGC AB-539-N05]